MVDQRESPGKVALLSLGGFRPLKVGDTRPLGPDGERRPLAVGGETRPLAPKGGEWRTCSLLPFMTVDELIPDRVAELGGTRPRSVFESRRLWAFGFLDED